MPKINYLGSDFLRRTNTGGLDMLNQTTFLALKDHYSASHGDHIDSHIIVNFDHTRKWYHNLGTLLLLSPCA